MEFSCSQSGVSMNAITFVVIAALAAGSYNVLQRIAAPGIDQAFGALLIALVATAVSLAVLALTRGHRPLYTDPSIFLLIALIGVAAFSVDYFLLQAYSRGLSLSVGSPIFVGISIATATIAGFAIGESMALVKLVGIGLITLGAIVLSVFG
jgi:bacterial/archaeal transporter family protein